MSWDKFMHKMVGLEFQQKVASLVSLQSSFDSLCLWFTIILSINLTGTLSFALLKYQVHKYGKCLFKCLNDYTLRLTFFLFCQHFVKCLTALSQSSVLLLLLLLLLLSFRDWSYICLYALFV